LSISGKLLRLPHRRARANMQPELGHAMMAMPTRVEKMDGAVPGIATRTPQVLRAPDPSAICTCTLRKLCTREENGQSRPASVLPTQLVGQPHNRSGDHQSVERCVRGTWAAGAARRNPSWALCLLFPPPPRPAHLPRVGCAATWWPWSSANADERPGLLRPFCKIASSWITSPPRSLQPFSDPRTVFARCRIIIRFKSAAMAVEFSQPSSPPPPFPAPDVTGCGGSLPTCKARFISWTRSYTRRSRSTRHTLLGLSRA
jgi:hypothetical protein